MDQLDEARDITLHRSAKYQQALRRHHNRRVPDRAFNIGDLVLCLVQSNKDRLVGGRQTHQRVVARFGVA